MLASNRTVQPSIAVLCALALAASLLVLSLPRTGARAQPVPEGIRATIIPTDPPSDVAGTVTIRPEFEDDEFGWTVVEIVLEGLTPGFHGIRISAGTDCVGAPGTPIGRLPPVLASADGQVWHTLVVDDLTVEAVLGRVVTVHAEPDNLAHIPARYSSSAAGAPPSGPDAETRATGDAGEAVGCGVFTEPVDDEPDFPDIGEDVRMAALVDDVGMQIGDVVFVGGESGVLVLAIAWDLTPGFHGFHLHQGPRCTDAAGRIDFDEAGGHWNPGGRPHGAHAGDMPPLVAVDDEIALSVFVTDRFTVADLDERAVVVHAEPDNLAHIPPRYSSSADGAPPAGSDAMTRATGDAGDRVACGIVDGTGVRLSGPNRFETAVAISRASFPDGFAESAVIARADRFADALAGTPLAIARFGPLLLSTTESLGEETAAELRRALEPGATVYILGGERALSPAVEQAVRRLGFRAQRLAGSTRIETALEIARELDDPQDLLITTGYRFPDALAAGAAAGWIGGGVLLTIGEQRHPAVDAFLDEHPDADLYAVGGPAARPYTEANPVVGRDRIATAVRVAETFFTTPLMVGLARQGGVGDDTDTAFADALTGGAHAGRNGGPVLLTPTGGLAPRPTAYIEEHGWELTIGYLYGGTAALAPQVHPELEAALRAPGDLPEMARSLRGAFEDAAAAAGAPGQRRLPPTHPR